MEDLEHLVAKENQSTKSAKTVQVALSCAFYATEIVFFGGAFYGLYQLNEHKPFIATLFLPLYVTGMALGPILIRAGYEKLACKMADKYYGKF